MLPDGVVEFPFDLPAHFVSSLGCPSPAQFIALFWRGDDLIFNDGSKEGDCPDPWQGNDFFEQTQIEGWFLDHEDIQLGYAPAIPATHWLVVDTAANDAMMAPIEIARRIVQEQNLE